MFQVGTKTFYWLLFFYIAVYREMCLLELKRYFYLAI